MSMQRDDLARYLDERLEAARFRDYCPNGLQVEGRAEVRRIVCGVTACQALIDTAVVNKADAILVHHGWFWKSEDHRILSFRKRRLATLLAHDINLYAYHLPLDAHPELGNNVQLALRLGWSVTGRFGEQQLGFLGSCEAITAGDLAARMGKSLGRMPQLIGDPGKTLQRIAWCSGGAQGYFEEAIVAGADCFVSGEISEQTVHLARETGISFIAAGHHATERYGVQALGTHLQDQFGLSCNFIDINNPV